MHQGVGMWFMLFMLGVVYYFLPQQLNRPIYSYSLGILAFWTQILFYTLIGTHHFVFSAIPWRSEEHTSELQSLMRISYAVFCLKRKKRVIRYNEYNHIVKK